MIKLTTVNKIAFLNNIGFSDGEKNSVLHYMNSMSSKGLHIKGFGVITNGFVMDESVRYVYAGCGRKEDEYFEESPDWEHVLDRYGIEYYRKKLPGEVYSFYESFINEREETEWLCERMDDGYLLCGVDSGEYVFEKTASRSADAEYYVGTAGENESLSDFLLSKQDEGWNFIAVAPCGRKCYFSRQRGLSAARRSDKIKRSLQRATAGVAVCMAAMAATLVLTVYDIYSSLSSGESAVGVFLVGGCASVVLGTLIIAELGRRYMLSERYKRLRARELAGSAEAAVSADDSSDVSAEGRLAKALSPLLRAVFSAVAALAVMAGAVVYCWRWFSLGIGYGYLGLTVAFLCIAFFPFVFYSAISALTEALKRR